MTDQPCASASAGVGAAHVSTVTVRPPVAAEISTLPGAERHIERRDAQTGEIQDRDFASSTS
jgi:hypothetical protein